MVRQSGRFAGGWQNSGRGGEENPFEILEESDDIPEVRASSSNKKNTNTSEPSSEETSNFAGLIDSDIDASFFDQIDKLAHDAQNPQPPVSSSSSSSSRVLTTNCDISSKQLREVLRDQFGFDQFREGQEEAILRVMRGESTLLVIPTGAGKSLCYQMVSHLKPSTLVLVVSPLVALMKDQLANLPGCIKGAVVNSHMKADEQEAILDDVRQSRTQVLFVSPEKVTSEGFIKMCKDFPPISLVCIDEAHCVSEWSHNFRQVLLIVET